MKRLFNSETCNKKIIAMFFAFFALDFVIICVTSIADWYFDHFFYALIPEPHDWEDAFIENLIFWLDWIAWFSSLAAIAGVMLWMIIPQKLVNAKTRSVCFCVSAIFAAVFSAGLFIATGYAAFVCLIGAVFSAASALSLLFWQLVKSLPPKMTGMFIGFALALMILLRWIVFSGRYWELSMNIMIAIPCALALGAAVVWLTTIFRDTTDGQGNSTLVDNSASRLIDPHSPAFNFALVTVVCLVFLISPILVDQLFYFYDSFTLIPEFWLILLILDILIVIFAGLLFDKGSKIYPLLVGILLVGTCQALALFFETPWVGVVYYIFSDSGRLMLRAVAIAAPLYYASRGNRFILPQTGYLFYTLGAFAVSITFSNVREVLNTVVIFNEQFNPVLGIALLLTFAGIALVFVLIYTHDRHERRAALAASSAPAISDIRQKLISAAVTPLTPRELEVAELTILGIKRKIIADTLFIQSSTVDSHRISIYNKFGVRTRDELLHCID